MKNIYIDTDCGMDDIIAITMLLTDANISVEAISTVNGLTNPYVGKKNLEMILNFLETTVRISAGSEEPLRKSRYGYAFPEQDIINSSKLSFLQNLIKNTKKTRKKTAKFRGKLTLLCIGPLTNIARALIKNKNWLAQRVEKIIIMGGAVYVSGNVQPQKLAEYNFFLDPEAADIVLSSNIPITLVSLDATKYVPADQAFKKKVAKIFPKTNSGKLIKKLITSNSRDYRYFYDPLAASILIDPTIITCSRAVSIKVSVSGLNSGQCLLVNNKNSVNLITNVNKTKFQNLLLSKIN